ncbi:MAG: hypothetical protein IJX67_01480 [Oscillospiraceae bacterium]|nr:hypothetical protein [Oscillospiraceae bacterium]MBQ9167065.1 hypothetical protein [Oscillospiraceae bacterium]
MDPYQALANAIVEVAVQDYKTALKYHYRHPDRREYADEVSSLERFFRSGWYGMLTNLDGELLMNGVRRMVRQEVAA